MRRLDVCSTGRALWSDLNSSYMAFQQINSEFFPWEWRIYPMQTGRSTHLGEGENQSFKLGRAQLRLLAPLRHAAGT